MAPTSVSNFTFKQVMFVVMTSVLGLGYLIQFNIIKNLAEGHSIGGSNNNNNLIVIPFIHDSHSHDSPRGGRSSSERRMRTAAAIMPKPQRLLRTRIMESEVMDQLQSALQPTQYLIQPPLGEGTSEHDKTLNHYSKDFRGTDMALPENTLLRSNRIVYLITPTYKRRTQIVDLTRLSQTLRLAREAGYHERLYWIIIEDADKPTQRVRQLAEDSGIPFAHKAVTTPAAIRRRPKAHRGLEQRNAGLDIVEQVGAEGVVYFMDDDNAYHVQLFHELAYTTHVSVFGVGMPGGSAYERCHVDPKTGKVDKLLTTWQVPRKFPMDMAGFAFATHHLAHNSAAGDKMRFHHKSISGFLENDLILYAANSVPELEPLAANCTRILTWHVKTVGNDLYYNPEPNKDKFKLMVGLV